MRPLSPHLQVYKPQITSVLSITHRMTGGVLTLAFLGLVTGILILGFVPSWWPCMDIFFEYRFVKICLGGILFSTYYHWLNGLRHLLWDVGLGFELKHLTISGWAVVIISIFTTLITLWIW